MYQTPDLFKLLSMFCSFFQIYIQFSFVLFFLRNTKIYITFCMCACLVCVYVCSCTCAACNVL